MKKALLILCYAAAIAVSIKSFREPDLWWQIRTGEWILENGEVPKQDVFSFTMAGTEWINIKWGFEVAAALIARLLGPESVFILQAVINCLLVFFLFRLSRLYFRSNGAGFESESPGFLPATAISFLILLVSVEYRMIGRPEMISHLLAVVFLFLLEKNRASPSRSLYLIVPLQMVWANFHEAFGIGLVILLIYTVVAWIDSLMLGRKNAGEKKLSMLLLASVASVVVNPNGVQLLERPFNIMSQVYVNKYTTELLDVTTSGWWQKEAWLALAMGVVSIFALLLAKPDAKNKLSGFRKFVSVMNKPWLLVVLAFFYLGLTAYRNLAFLSLVCFPLFHFMVYSFFRKWPGTSPRMKKVSGIFSIAILVVFYAGVVSNRYYTFTESRDRFGLEVLSVNNPVGASEFILQKNLKNKKCFSDYLTSSYLLWKLQPEFKTYIDLRDLDVFPPAFFESFLRDANIPYSYFRLDSVQDFRYAVVFRPQFDQLHAYLYNDSIYALTYVDAVAAVYEKTDDFSRTDIFSDCKPVQAGMFATTLNKILNPFYTPFRYASVENNYLAANYYLNVGRPDLAVKRAEAMLPDKKTSYKGHEMIGRIYFQSAMREQSDSAKMQMLAAAEESFRLSLRENQGFASSWQGLGAVHFTQKSYAAALKAYLKSLEINNEDYQAHLSIAQCYRELMSGSKSKREEYRSALLHHFLKANSLNPGNPMVLANIGFVYFQANDCDNAVRYLSKVSGDLSLSEADRQAVQNCLRQCGH